MGIFNDDLVTTKENNYIDKDFLYEAFNSIPGVSLTRSIKKAGGLFTEGTPVDGLPLQQPTAASSATSRKYVDAELTKLLPRDGSRNMSASLQMGNNRIENVETPIANKDATTKEYVDDSHFPKQAHTVSEYSLHSRNFSNPDGRLSTFSFGVYKDFVKKYHTAPVHVVCSLSASPCTIRVDLGVRTNRFHSIRVEAFVDPTGDDGSLDLTITPLTKKYKPLSNIVVTNTVFDRTTTIDIRITYKTGSEIALFLYGVPGQQYVRPFVIDNYPKLALDGTTQMTGDLNMGNQKVTNVAKPTSNKDAVNKAWFERYISIPRYSSFEKYDRRDNIIVKIVPYEKESFHLVGPSSRTIFEFSYTTGRKQIEFCFPCLVCLSGIKFNSANDSASIDTDWNLNYYDETGLNLVRNNTVWINLPITNYEKWTGQRVEAEFTPRISRCFELIFNNILTGTKMYSFDFVTTRGVYDSAINTYPS